MFPTRYRFLEFTLKSVPMKNAASRRPNIFVRNPSLWTKRKGRKVWFWEPIGENLE